MSCLRVGVFDSGVGGLTVLHECRRLLPSVRFGYLGDNDNAPYGSRPDEEIAALAERGLETLRDWGADAVVIACNTVTAVAAEFLRARFPFPIVGMEPALRPAAAECSLAYVLCTPATAASARLGRLIDSLPSCKFVVLPCPRLAAAVERAVLTRGLPDLSCLPPLPQGESGNFVPAQGGIGQSVPPRKGIVLGCTHYLFFRAEIAAFYGLKPYDGNAGAARRLASLLGTADTETNVRETVGTDFHLLSPRKLHDYSADFIDFLGKTADFNKKVYETNKCFQNF